VALFLSENYPEPLEYRFELERAAIRVSGNVAITHYLVVIRAKDEIRSGPSQTVRLTHTWIKAGADWKILGGMSSTVPVSSR
jgi:ketosteroid isomerase-like protein